MGINVLIEQTDSVMLFVVTFRACASETDPHYFVNTQIR